ncbi:lipid droplet-associated protein [Cumulibacter soli]|uniref:lipid droplet-associated protein n=1 Tax=Cumulibacter soli TaxID=2546344 RepID=UPI001068914D|nr:lipid droplet-associated protein [Cumulibacter soli]
MPSSPVPPSVAAFLPADLPSPLKAIAGIAVTMVHDAKNLPERAGQLPTSLLTHLAAKSLKVQQQYAQWVARGEEFLGALQEPSEEVPPWATFDEDLPSDDAQDDELAAAGLGPGSAFDMQDTDDLPVARHRAGTRGERDESAATANDSIEAPTPVKKPSGAKKSAPAKKAAPAKKSAPAKKAAPAKKSSPKNAAPAKASTGIATKKSAPAKKAAPAAEPGQDVADSPSAAASGPVKLTTADVNTGDPRATSTPGAPQPLPEFDTLTIPQLRTRLKSLRTPQITELIGYEEATRNRPAVLGMLRARLDTLQK